MHSTSSTNPPLRQAKEPWGKDFLAFQARHEQVRRMTEGKAGQFRVRTVRPPPPATHFMAQLLESETEGEEAAEDTRLEGPVAYLVTNTGLVMRVGYPRGDPSEGQAQGFAPLWQTQLSSDLPRALAREGDVLACATDDGRVHLLHAGTGRLLQLESQDGVSGVDAVIDTGLNLPIRLLWLYVGLRLPMCV